MSTTPPDEPTQDPGSTPPSAPDYGTPPPSAPDYGYGTPPGGAGGYGTPPGGYGGYGATPPGGYGTPPPAGGPYGGADPSGWSLGDAISYGWKKFTENAAQIILTALVFLVATAVAVGVAALIMAALTDTASLDLETGDIDGSSRVANLLAQALASIVVSVVLMTLGAAIVRGSLDVTEGRRFELGASFTRINFGNVLVASVLVSIATSIGTALCYVPGLVIGFLTSYTLYFVVDRDLGAVDAIKASFQLTTKNLGNTVLWYVVGGIIALVGFCLCGVGALVTVPVVVLGTAFTYKRLTGQPVAA